MNTKTYKVTNNLFPRTFLSEKEKGLGTRMDTSGFWESRNLRNLESCHMPNPDSNLPKGDPKAGSSLSTGTYQLSELTKMNGQSANAMLLFSELRE